MHNSPEQRCAFLPHRVCHVEADEIPLEVCRLCIEAWANESGNVTVKRSMQGLEATETAASALKKPTLQALPSPEAEVPLKPEPEQAPGSLTELDRLFAEGKIGLGEYLESRKRVVNSAKRGNSRFAALEAMLDRPERGAARTLLLEEGKVKAKYPEDWALPSGFEGRLLKAVYELYMASNGQGVDARLEAEGMRVISLGCMGKKLALLFLDSSVKPEYFEDEVMKARSELETHGNWQAILPKLCQEIPRKPALLI